METINHTGYIEVIAAEGCVLHRAGTVYMAEPLSRLCGAIAADDYEELTTEEYAARRLQEYRDNEYKRRLAEAVHERYSVDDELALAANINAPALLDDETAADSVAAEYVAYQQYRAECKARVMAEVAEIAVVPGEEPVAQEPAGDDEPECDKPEDAEPAATCSNSSAAVTVARECRAGLSRQNSIWDNI